MYRIKLTNGTVLEFDSLDALTVDIHAGVVDADALIFHQRANQWLPIHVHPAWKHAMAAPRKTPAAPKPTGATPSRSTSTPAAGSNGSGPAAALRPLPRPGQPSAEKPATPAPKSTPSAAAPRSTPTAGGSATATASASLTSLDLDLLEPEPAAPVQQPVPKAAPASGTAPRPAKPAPSADSASAASSASKNGSPARTAQDAPSAAATKPAPRASETAATKAPAEPSKAGAVSVDSLDEVLELIAPDELEVPAPPPAIAPRPAGKAAPREEAAPITQVAAQASATNAALAALGLQGNSAAEDTPAAAAPSAPAADAASAAPSNAAPAPTAPAAEPSAAKPAAPVALPVPAPTASADSLVPAATLLVVPVEESVTLATPVATARTVDAITTSDLASDFAIDVQPLPAPEPELSPAHVAEPVELLTTTAEQAVPVAIASAPARRAPNRTLWYVGGAVAAGVVITAVALRRSGTDAPASAPASTEQRSANPALPGAPLAPPSGTSGDSAPVLGRIEPPAELALDPAESRGTSAREEKAKETKKSKDETARDAKAEAAEAKAAESKKGKTDSAKNAVVAGEDGVIVAPTADFKSLGAITVKSNVDPSVLASRYSAAHDAAWNDLVARLRLAGFDNLFAPARTAPSGASSARASVAAARAHIAQWRTRTSTIEKAYRDSSVSLASAGQWDAGEQKEWEGRPRRGESGESAQQVNAILAAADRLFFILAANASGYEAINDGLRFTDTGAQRDYWEARRAFLGATGAAGSAEPRTPLAAVLKALGGRPPEGVNAN